MSACPKCKFKSDTGINQLWHDTYCGSYDSIMGPERCAELDAQIRLEMDTKTKPLVLEPEMEDSLEKNRLRGNGGAPTRATLLPIDASSRKNFPIASGVLDYFPDALVAISEISKAGNDQHNPGLPLQWSRDKSGDEADTCIRHFLQRGTLDTDGKRHTAKAAWRMLALLQKEIEKEQELKDKK